MNEDSTHVFEFGEFRLDTSEHLLVRDGQPVPLTPKAFEMLVLLVAKSGRLVEKDELIKRLWPDSFVEESNLTHNVWTLRKALGDSQNGQRYIETVPKRGYRFTADVRELNGANEELVVEKRSFTRIVTESKEQTANVINVTPTGRRLAFTRRLTARNVGFVIFGAFALGLAVAGYRFFNRASSNSGPIKSLAVLPFANEGESGNIEYLSDGITESLINSLSQMPNLSVKARSTVFRYKGKQVEPQQIGSELSVQAILTGRVVQRGDDLTIYLSLVDAGSGNQIWGEQYNRKLTNLVAVQSEITRDVSQKLRAQLSASNAQKLGKSYTSNSEAYQLYLKGRYEWNKHTQDDVQRAIGYFNEALKKDPNYALAYAGLSDSYGVLGNNYLPPNDAFPHARDYATKALALDDELAEAHLAMGAIELYYDRNWAEAEREMKSAQALNPNYAHACHLYADRLEIMGEFDQAQVERRCALELEPMSPMYNMASGATLYLARQNDQAINQLEKTINLEPRFVLSYPYLAQAYEQKKMYAQAIATCEQGLVQAERHPLIIAALARAYALSGERDKALKTLAELREMSRHSYVSPYLFAIVYAGLGDNDQTFAWLDKAYQDRSLFLIWLKVEPLFDSLRDDRRFQELTHRVGL